MDNALDGRVIVVTGASQGLGAEVAQTCARAGATVVLIARHQKKLEAVYDAIVAAAAAEPFAVRFDLLPATDQDFDQLAETVLQAAGRVDGLVHCASHFNALSPLAFQTVAQWVDQYRINTVAPMALTRAFFPALKAAPDASVLFVGETHSETPQAYWGGFGASKAALNYLAQVLADEWAQYPHLRANVLVPGAIHSPQRIKSHPGEARHERKEVAAVAPEFIYWLGADSRGRSGEIIYL